MNYIEITIETTRVGVEMVVGKLLSLGIIETVVDDPFDIEMIMGEKESYEWDYIDDEVTKNMDRNPKVIVYLEDTEENQRRKDKINEAMIDLLESSDKGLLDFLEVNIKEEDDSEWKDRWKEFFKPKKISDTIVVKPTWEEYTPKEDEKIIEIDPGMAFGTGTHETTSMCIKALEKYLKKEDKVIDVGTGSGILSIAAALLGAKEILGIDIDEVAIEVAKKNVELNRVLDRVDLEVGDLTKNIDFKADIIVGNLMADLVVMLASDVKRNLKEGSKFISSGILVEKMDFVIGKLEENNFKVVDKIIDGEWCCLVCAL